MAIMSGECALLVLLRYSGGGRGMGGSWERMRVRGEDER